MKLQCNFEYSTRLKYICEVVEVTKKSEKHTLEVKTREHVPGKTNADVEILRIRMKPLKFIPKGLFLMFPNVRMLTIVDCGLKNISRKDLVGLKSLELLNLSKNKLKSLPNDLFADCQNLREIYFDNNRIEFMSSKIFEPIERTLMKAVFAGNARVNETFDKRDAFRGNFTKFKEIVDLACLPPQNSSPESQKSVIEESEKREQMCESSSEFKTTGNFTDKILKFRTREFKVHKRILEAQSPVFKQIFNACDYETIEISEKTLKVSENSFANFVDFFYSGESGHGNHLEMFELAMVFEVANLKSTCTTKILSSLNESNALEVFNFAHRKNCDKLKKPAFEIIQKLIPEVPDNLIDKPHYINKLMSFRRESLEALNRIITASQRDLQAVGENDDEGFCCGSLAKRMSRIKFNIFKSCKKQSNSN